MSSIERRSSGVISVGSIVSAFDQITFLLEFDREEESRRRVDALHVDAWLNGYARSDVGAPEVPAAGVRLATEEVKIMLAGELGRVVALVDNRTIFMQV